MSWPQYWKNGQRIAADTLDIRERGLSYGDGGFTTIHIRAGQPALWRWHWQRLQAISRALHLPLPSEQMLLADIQQATAGLDEGSAKLIISRGPGDRGYLPPQQPATRYLLVAPYQRPAYLPGQGIHSGLLPDMFLSPVMPQLAGLKTLNRLEQVLLRQALSDTSWPEALVCDEQGYIVEGIHSNICYQLGQQPVWWTPPINRCGIRGVFRQFLLDQGLIQCRPLNRHDLPLISSLCFCNALSGLVPVSQLDDCSLQTRPATDLIQHLQHLNLLC